MVGGSLQGFGAGMSAPLAGAFGDWFRALCEGRYVRFAIPRMGAASADAVHARRRLSSQARRDGGSVEGDTFRPGNAQVNVGVMGPGNHAEEGSHPTRVEQVLFC